MNAIITLLTLTLAIWILSRLLRLIMGILKAFVVTFFVAGIGLVSYMVHSNGLIGIQSAGTQVKPMTSNGSVHEEMVPQIKDLFGYKEPGSKNHSGDTLNIDKWSTHGGINFYDEITITLTTQEQQISVPEGFRPRFWHQDRNNPLSFLVHYQEEPRKEFEILTKEPRLAHNKQQGQVSLYIDSTMYSQTITIRFQPISITSKND